MASSHSDEEKQVAVSSGEDTVVLGDRSLDRIAVCLGNVYFRLGLLLNLARPFIEQLEVKFPKDLYRLNFEVLLKWRDDNCHRPNMVNGLIETLHTLGKNDVVEIVRDEVITQLKEDKRACRERGLREQQQRKAAEDEVRQLKEAIKREREQKQALEETAKREREQRQAAERTVKREQELRKAAEASSHNNQQRLLVVGGLTPKKEGTGIDNHRKISYWVEETQCWRLLTEVPQSVRRLYGVCQVARDLLMLTGGSVGGVTQAVCWQVNLLTKVWTQLPSMITPRKYHRSVLVGDHVIVVGGKDGNNKATGSTEQYSFTQHQWTPLPAMPWPVRNPAATSHGHKVFVFGGRDDDNKNLLCTRAYDTKAGKWLTLGDMPEVCDLGAAVSLGQYVYLVGGFSRSCLRYDPATDSWMRLSQPRLEHANAPAVVWQGGIVVAGGMTSDESRLTEIEYYSPGTDEWSDWQASLEVKLDTHRLFSVTLPDV